MAALADYDFGQWVHAVKVKDVEEAVKKSASTHIMVGAVTSEIVRRVSALGVVNFKGAMDTIFTLDNGQPIPDTPDHVIDHIGCADGLRAYVEAAAAGRRVIDQISASLPGLYKIAPRFRRQLKMTCFDQLEYFLQAGNRYSPPHFDHGHVLAFLPSYCSSCVKIWVSIPYAKLEGFKCTLQAEGFMEMVKHPHSTVIIQEPGDVVHQSPISCHAVMLAYKKGTQDDDRSCVLGGTVFIQDADVYEAYINATKTVMGTRQRSPAAWTRVLTAFCAINGRQANLADPVVFENEKKAFMVRVGESSGFNLGKRQNALNPFVAER